LVESSVPSVVPEFAGGGVFAQHCPIGTGWVIARYASAAASTRDSLIPSAQLGGTVQLWEWTGDGATTFSY
jgi:hypothetical protein